MPLDRIDRCRNLQILVVPVSALKDPAPASQTPAAKHLDAWSSGPLARPSAPRRSRSRTQQRQPSESNVASGTASPSNSERGNLFAARSRFSQNHMADVDHRESHADRSSWCLCTRCQGPKQSQPEYSHARTKQRGIRCCYLRR